MNEEWIPVYKRLPENDGKYLVTINYGFEKEVTISRYCEGEWTSVSTEVFAWMPLPDPFADNLENVHNLVEAARSPVFPGKKRLPLLMKAKEYLDVEIESIEQEGGNNESK